jgi:hypothetical protein
MSVVVRFPSNLKDGVYSVTYEDFGRYGGEYACDCPGFRTRKTCQHVDFAKRMGLTTPYEILQDNRIIAGVTRAFKECGIDIEALINKYSPYVWQAKMPMIAEKIKQLVVQQVVRDEVSPELLRYEAEEKAKLESEKAKREAQEKIEAETSFFDVTYRPLILPK